MQGFIEKSKEKSNTSARVDRILMMTITGFNILFIKPEYYPEKNLFFSKAASGFDPGLQKPSGLCLRQPSAN